MAPSNPSMDQSFINGRKFISKRVGPFVGAVAFYELIHTLVIYSECDFGTHLYEDFTVYTNPAIFVLVTLLSVMWEIKMCTFKGRVELLIIPIITWIITACNMVKLVFQIQKMNTMELDYYCSYGLAYYWTLTIFSGLSLAAQKIMIMAGFFVVKNPSIAAAMETPI